MNKELYYSQFTSDELACIHQSNRDAVAKAEVDSTRILETFLDNHRDTIEQVRKYLQLQKFTAPFYKLNKSDFLNQDKIAFDATGATPVSLEYCVRHLISEHKTPIIIYDSKGRIVLTNTKLVPNKMNIPFKKRNFIFDRNDLRVLMTHNSEILIVNLLQEIFKLRSTIFAFNTEYLAAIFNVVKN